MDYLSNPRVLALIEQLSRAGIVERIDEPDALTLETIEDGASPTDEVAFTGPDGNYQVRNVTVPTLTPYLPTAELATGAAMIVAPGGGFFTLEMQKEGWEVAEWLRERGVAAFVLKYRLRHGGKTQAEFARTFVSEVFGRDLAGRSSASVADVTAPGPGRAVDDVAAAIRLVRARAAEWSVRRDRVGVVGFSAGAYAAAGLLRRSSNHPDVLACVYGGYAGPDELRTTSLPPLFATVGLRDQLVSADLLDLVNSWRARDSSAEAHIYDSPDHGFGIAQSGRSTDPWIDRFEEWLTRLGYIGDHMHPSSGGRNMPAARENSMENQSDPDRTAS